MLSLVFVFVACGSNTDDTKNSGDSTSQLLGERVTFEDGGFSIQPPKNWDMKDIGIKYDAFLDSTRTDFYANIDFIQENYSGSLDDYVDANIVTMKRTIDNFKIVKQSYFTTLSGLKGTKLIATNKQLSLQLQQMFYIFELDKDTKIVITCSDLQTKADTTDAIFEESASTFKVDK